MSKAINMPNTKANVNIRVPKFDVEAKVKELNRKIEKIKAVLIIDNKRHYIQRMIQEDKKLRGHNAEDILCNNVSYLIKLSETYKTSCEKAKNDEEKEALHQAFLSNIESLKIVKTILSKETWQRISDGNFSDLKRVNEWVQIYRNVQKHGYNAGQMYQYKEKLEEKLRDYAVYNSPKNSIEVNGVTVTFGNSKEKKLDGRKEENYERIARQLEIEDDLVDINLSDERCEEYVREMLTKKKVAASLKSKFAKVHGKRPELSRKMKFLYYFRDLFLGEPAPHIQWDKDFFDDTVRSFKEALIANYEKRVKAQETYSLDEAEYQMEYYRNLILARQQNSEDKYYDNLLGIKPQERKIYDISIQQAAYKER